MTTVAQTINHRNVYPKKLSKCVYKYVLMIFLSVTTTVYATLYCVDDRKFVATNNSNNNNE